MFDPLAFVSETVEALGRPEECACVGGAGAGAGSPQSE
jgi:hypothetical protein